MDLPIEVPLKRPIVLDGQTYDKLTVDEPDLNMQIAYAELETGFSDPPTPVDAVRVNLFWISNLAEIPEKVAVKIKDTDLAAVMAAVSQALGIDDSEEADVEGAQGNETPAK